jgi:hypothetical protein
MASSNSKATAVVLEFEVRADELPTPPTYRRARRRRQTVFVHQRNRAISTNLHRKTVSEMKSLKRTESRPQSNHARHRPQTQRGHPRKHMTHRSGRMY